MLLDTNAYSALRLNNPAIVKLVQASIDIKLPLPVVAELRYGFAKGTRTAQNEELLQTFMSQPKVSIALPSYETSKHYARLQLHCQQRGKALSHNDLWIAAIALEVQGTLVTYDQDFRVFQNVLADKLIILES